MTYRLLSRLTVWQGYGNSGQALLGDPLVMRINSGRRCERTSFPGGAGRSLCRADGPQLQLSCRARAVPHSFQAQAASASVA